MRRASFESLIAAWSCPREQLTPLRWGLFCITHRHNPAFVQFERFAVQIHNHPFNRTGRIQKRSSTLASLRRISAFNCSSTSTAYRMGVRMD